jgi:hypothetical protein
MESTSHFLEDAKTARDLVGEGGDHEVKIGGQKSEKLSRTAHKNRSELITPKVIKKNIKCCGVTKGLNYSYLNHYNTGDDQNIKEESYFCDRLEQKLYNIYHTIEPSLENLDVILDSGATAHMFPSPAVFQTYTNISEEGRHVSLGDDNMKIPIVGKGRVNILGDALHVPLLNISNLSIQYL